MLEEILRLLPKGKLVPLVTLAMAVAVVLAASAGDVYYKGSDLFTLKGLWRIPVLVMGSLLLVLSAWLFFEESRTNPDLPDQSEGTATDKNYVPQILKLPLLERRAQLSQKMRKMLAFIEKYASRPVHQDVIEEYFKDFGTKSEIYYRLEVLYLQGLIEKQSAGTNVNGWERHIYKLSDAYRHQTQP